MLLSGKTDGNVKVYLVSMSHMGIAGGRAACLWPVVTRGQLVTATRLCQVMQCSLGYTDINDKVRTTPARVGRCLQQHQQCKLMLQILWDLRCKHTCHHFYSSGRELSSIAEQFFHKFCFYYILLRWDFYRNFQNCQHTVPLLCNLFFLCKKPFNA